MASFTVQVQGCSMSWLRPTDGIQVLLSKFNNRGQNELFVT